MPEDSAPKFLIVRLGSLGDLVHTLPAVAALRSAFAQATIDWVVQEKWRPLIELVPVVDSVIPLRKSVAGHVACVRRLRSAHYSCAIDFQGLYKSAVLARLSGAGRRIGFDRTGAREPGAVWFYTDRVAPGGPHISEANLSLAIFAGAKGAAEPCGLARFPICCPEEARRGVLRKLLAEGIRGEYVVLSPGGGWKSKCWPAERYGEVCTELWQRHGIPAVINIGPGEDELAVAVLGSSAPAAPLVFRPTLPELVALVSMARMVIAADTGPLHLAAALGTRVVALFGPTDPARNGPVPGGLVLRNVSYAGTTHGRSAEYSAAMLLLTVKQVADAAEQQLGPRHE